jgi:thiamine transport system substrate-binding protein
MKHFVPIFLCISCTFFFVFSGCSRKAALTAERTKEVVVYTYDAFISEWGPGPTIAKNFKAKTGYTVSYVNCGDGAQILSKAILEKKNVQADILLGLDNNLIGKARSEGILLSYKPEQADTFISTNLITALGNDWLLTPYDYSLFALIYDTQSGTLAPHSLEDLIKPEYAKKLILMDPRTSTPGLGFVAWTVAVFGNDYVAYWKSLKPSILTMAPGWSAGYGLFTKGEAPLVISYITSPAYHIECDKTNRYQALIFDEGHVQQVEGAGIAAGAPNKKAAKAFIDYLISNEAQNILPLTQWMYPANRSIALPDCYKTAVPVIPRTISYTADDISAAVPAIMQILDNGK